MFCSSVVSVFLLPLSECFCGCGHPLDSLLAITARLAIAQGSWEEGVRCGERTFHKRRNDNSRAMHWAPEFETQGGSCQVNPEIARETAHSKDEGTGLGVDGGLFRPAVHVAKQELWKANAASKKPLFDVEVEQCLNFVARAEKRVSELDAERTAEMGSLAEVQDRLRRLEGSRVVCMVSVDSEVARQPTLAQRSLLCEEGPAVSQTAHPEPRETASDDEPLLPGSDWRSTVPASEAGVEVREFSQDGIPHH